MTPGQEAFAPPPVDDKGLNEERRDTRRRKTEWERVKETIKWKGVGWEARAASERENFELLEFPWQVVRRRRLRRMDQRGRRGGFEGRAARRPRDGGEGTGKHSVRFRAKVTRRNSWGRPSRRQTRAPTEDARATGPTGKKRKMRTRWLGGGSLRWRRMVA